MKTKVAISFSAEDIPGEADAILVPAGCGSDVAEVLAGTVMKIRTVDVYIKLDEGDERVAKVFALLAHHGVEVNSFTYDEYSEEDRQQARLLWVGPSSFDDQVYASLGLGTEYDLANACPNCKTGAELISPLYVAERCVTERYLAKIRKHRAIMTMEGHILVDGGMVKKLKDAGVTGIAGFGDVRARKENGKWIEVARDQILIEHVLPPMRGEFKAAAEDERYRCKVCRRGGRRGAPDKPYREEDLVSMCDFNLTWEWFGEFWPEYKDPEDPRKSRSEKRSSPGILVTPKVMNIFRDAGVKTFQWTPVAIDP